MVLWVIAAAALIGWALSDFEEYGLILGGIFGTPMGFWLRAAIRGEIARAVAQGESPAAAHAEWTPPPPLAAAPVEPARREAVADTPPASDNPTLAQAWRESAAAAQPVSAPEPDLPHEPSLVEQWADKARDWLLGGNTIVRVGLLILFVGLTFLARFAAQAGLFPLEARLALVAAAGAVLLGIGFAKRTQRPAFGLALQGTGVATLYLTVFAAARLFSLISPVPAFGLMLVFSAFGCALALLQNSRGMAFAAFLGGYAVPVLLGGESPTPLLPFGYYTILNLGVLVIAWRRSWRELNLLGFAATFGMATLWGLSRYGPEHYLICQLFLGLSVAIYLAMAVLYAHNTPGKLGNMADSTLLFGPALAGFGLQAGLVRDWEFGSAFAALGFGAAYLGVAALVLRQRREGMRLLNECLLAIGIGFVTLAVPLALDARWTSTAWALEGAGAFWVGLRQARWMPRLFGLALQGIAALIVLTVLQQNVAALPFASPGFLTPALVALPLLLTAWWLRRRLPHSGSALARNYAVGEHGLRHAVFMGGFGFACLALLQEVTRRLPAATSDAFPASVFAWHVQLLLGMTALLGAMGVAAWFGRKHPDLPAARWPARASLPLMVLTFLIAVAGGRHVLLHPDWLFWLAALALHGLLLRQDDAAQDGAEAGPLTAWTFAVHAAGVWLVAAMLADSLQLGIDRGRLWDTSWAGVVFLVSAVAILMGLTRWAGRAAPLASTRGLRWPLHPQARAYWLVAALPLAVLAYAGAMVAALFAAGVTDPLSYLPLLNPVDLVVALALTALALWRRMLAGARDLPEAVRPLLGNPGLAAGGILAFAAINGVWLRTAHHWLGVGWSNTALAQSPIVQTGLSILWTLLAMGLMLFAHRRALRISWLTGAGLLAVVVGKLLLLDMARFAGWERIVTFIAVGVLMLVIGYFVPLPPRKSAEESR